MVTDGAADAQAQAPTSNSSDIPLPQVIENEPGPGGGHAYPNHADTLVKVHLPGATQLSVTFDEQCETEERYDELRFFDHDPGDSKEERSENAFFTWSGRRTPDMMSKVSNPFWVGFQSDGSGVRWGYKFTVRDVRDPTVAAHVAMSEFTTEFLDVCESGKGDAAEDAINFEGFCKLARPKEDLEGIFASVAKGDTEAVRSFLERSGDADVACKESYQLGGSCGDESKVTTAIGDTLLATAVRTEQVQMCALLLAHGASWDTRIGEKTVADLAKADDKPDGFFKRVLAVAEETRREVTLKMLHKLPDTKSTQALVLSADGALLATGGQDKQVSVWSTETGALMCCSQDRLTAAVNCLAMSSDGQLLASGTDDGTITLWSVVANEVPEVPEPSLLYSHRLKVLCEFIDKPSEGTGQAAVQTVALSANGDVLCYGGKAQRLTLRTESAAALDLLKVTTGEKKLDTEAVAQGGGGGGGRGGGGGGGGGGAPRAEEAFSLEKAMATGWARLGGESTAAADLRGERIVHVFDLHHDVMAAVLSARGDIVATAAHSVVSVRSCVTGEVIHAFKNEQSVQALTMSPDGKLMAFGGDAMTVTLKETDTGQTIGFFRHTEKVRAIALSGDKQTMAAGGEDKAVTLYDVSAHTMGMVVPDYLFALVVKAPSIPLARDIALPLIQRGAANISDEYGTTALHLAVEHNDTAALAILLGKIGGMGSATGGGAPGGTAGGAPSSAPSGAPSGAPEAGAAWRKARPTLATVSAVAHWKKNTRVHEPAVAEAKARAPQLHLATTQGSPGDSTHGVFFDVVAKRHDVCVTSLKVCSTASSAPVQVFACMGGTGREHEEEGSYWRLVGTTTLAESDAMGKIVLDTPVPVPAGRVVGFHVFSDTSNVRFASRGTNESRGVDSVDVQNDDIALRRGRYTSHTSLWGSVGEVYFTHFGDVGYDLVQGDHHKSAEKEQQVRYTHTFLATTDRRFYGEHGDNRPRTALGLAIDLGNERCARLLVSAAKHLSPCGRRYVARHDLGPLLRTFPMLAEKLLADAGLDPCDTATFVRKDGKAEQRAALSSAVMAPQTKHLFKGHEVRDPQKQRTPAHSPARPTTRLPPARPTARPPAAISAHPPLHTSPPPATAPSLRRQWTTDEESRLVEPPSAWLWWKYRVGSRSSDDLVVSVEPRVLGFERICNNRDFLDSLCATKNMDIFDLQAVALVLEYHWNDRHFVFTMAQLVLYILLLVAFQTWLSSVYCDSDKPYCDSWQQQGCGFAAVALAGVFIAQEFVQIMMADAGGSAQAPVSRLAYFKSGWNVIDLGCHSLVLALTAIWLIDTSTAPNPAVSAVAGLLAYAKLLSYMRAFEPLSALVAVLAQVVRDAVPFLTILLIVLLGFASAIQSSGEPGFEGGMSLYNTYLIALNSEIFIEDGGFPTSDRKVLQVTCLLFASVVMMNLLIAVISDSFERVQEKKHAQFLLGRAQLIRDNNALFDFFALRESECRWLHVIQPVEGGGSDGHGSGLTEWAGRVRALKKKMENLTKATRDDLRETHATVSSVETELQDTRKDLILLREAHLSEAESASLKAEDASKKMLDILEAVKEMHVASAAKAEKEKGGAGVKKGE
jgi:WD40 repeat protein